MTNPCLYRGQLVAVVSALFLACGIFSNAHAQEGGSVVCPPVEVVFTMDTSGSMNDEAAALCNSISAVQAQLSGLGITAQTYLYGITSTGGSSFSCLTDDVENLLGSAVPGDGGACGNTLNHSESWGEAVAVVSQLFPWAPGAVRVVVPISDEGACNGNPCSDPGADRDAVTNATAIANANGVFVSPISGTGSSQCVIGLGQDLATSTGGTAFISTDPQLDLAGAVSDLIVAACVAANNPPTAVCKDVEVAADASCQGDASIDNGSFDADGDAFTLVQDPAGPYPLGSTLATLTATDTENTSSQCEGTVTVLDATGPAIECNVDTEVSGDNLPVSFTATITDNCATLGAPKVTSYSCSTEVDGTTVDTTAECDATLEGGSITINKIGSSTEVSWVVEGVDEAGNPTTKICSSAARVGTSPSGDGVVGCASYDATPQLQTLDGNAFSQRGVVRKLARALRKRGGKKSDARSLRLDAKSLYNSAWTFAWSIPAKTLSCETSIACVVEPLSESISQAHAESAKLDALVAKARKLLKKASGGKLRKRDKNLVAFAESLFAETTEVIDTLPKEQTTCGDGVTVLLN